MLVARGAVTWHNALPLDLDGWKRGGFGLPGMEDLMVFFCDTRKKTGTCCQSRAFFGVDARSISARIQIRGRGYLQTLVFRQRRRTTAYRILGVD